MHFYKGTGNKTGRRLNEGSITWSGKKNRVTRREQHVTEIFVFTRSNHLNINWVVRQRGHSVAFLTHDSIQMRLMGWIAQCMPIGRFVFMNWLPLIRKKRGRVNIWNLQKGLRLLSVRLNSKNMKYGGLYLLVFKPSTVILEDISTCNVSGQTFKLPIFSPSRISILLTEETHHNSQVQDCYKTGMMGRLGFSQYVWRIVLRARHISSRNLIK